MSMRLLQKSEIVKNKAIAQKQTIDEGMKLAKRVDNLREVVAQEEASLEKFRCETIAKIHDDITHEAHKREELKTEVSDLEKRRKELLRPLDREWKEIAKERVKIEQEAEKAQARILVAQQGERHLEKATKQTSDLLAKAITKDDLASEVLRDATDNERATKKALTNAQKVEKDALRLQEKMNKELQGRDADCAVRERDLDMKEVGLVEWEKELNKELKILNDRKQMIERNIKRIKK